MGWHEVLKDFRSLKNIIIVILTPLIFLPLIFAVDGKVIKCAYIFIIMATFWITEALPIAATSLLPVILFPLLGLMHAKDVSSMYLNDTTMLFIGGVIVASAIEQWDIHKRISLRILMLVGSEPRWLMLGLMLPSWLLSITIGNIPVTAMMAPIANAVLLQLKGIDDIEENLEGDNETIQEGIEHVQLRVSSSQRNTNENKSKDKQETKHVLTDRDDDENSLDDTSYENPEYLRMCKAFTLAIAYSANIGGIGSIVGTVPNLVMKGQADIVFESRGGISPITFANWMQFGIPVSALCFISLWIWFQIYFFRCRSFNSKVPGQADMVKNMIRKKYESLGPLTFAQVAVLVHFVLLAVLWISRNIGGVGGWGYIFPPKTVSDSTPSILIAASLFIFPSTIPRVFCLRKDGVRYKAKPLLSWSVATRKVPWQVVILLGSGFALARGSERSGLSSWLGEQLTVFSHLDPWVINLVLCYIVAAATEITSNTAICTLMMPIVAELSYKLDVNPLYFMFPSALATSFAFMLPVATPPNAIVFSYGYLKVKDLVMAGFVMNIVAVLILVLGTETWGEAIFHFHTLPDIFRENASVVVENVTTASVGLCSCNNTV